VARAAVAAVLAGVALAVAAPTSAEFDQPRPQGSLLEHGHAVGPTPPFDGAALTPPPPLPLPLPRCERATMARVEALAGLLRSLPLGGVLVAIVNPAGVCARARS
jgi:hypothetical protein